MSPSFARRTVVVGGRSKGGGLGEGMLSQGRVFLRVGRSGCRLSKPAWQRSLAGLGSHQRTCRELTAPPKKSQLRYRSIFSLFQKQTDRDAQTEEAILEGEALFHKLSESPMQLMRERGEQIRKYTKCPINGTAVKFECPNCGYPTHSTQEAWRNDDDHHMNVCSILREANEDEHDLRSGRKMGEFDMPTTLDHERALNFSNFDTLLYTRDFPAVNHPRAMRHVTKLLTYPFTVASVLHDQSPYRLRKGLTVEGLRSLTALRSTLTPKDVNPGSERYPKPHEIRVFVLGARAESMLPHLVWQQMALLFPFGTFNIYFIGPEAAQPPSAFIRDNHKHSKATTQCSFWTYKDLYQTLHEANEFAPYDPYHDVFFLFSPGIGHSISRQHWAPALPMLLETRCALFMCGYSEEDMKQDYDYFHEICAGEFDVLLEPQLNVFASQKWDISVLDIREFCKTNWAIWGARGKK